VISCDERSSEKKFNADYLNVPKPPGLSEAMRISDEPSGFGIVAV
jgi:hypothetical protein